MSNKSMLNNMLKINMGVLFSLGLMGCASNNSEDWPTMQADSLWQQLEEGQNDGTISNGNMTVTEQDANLSMPAIQESSLSLPDIRVSLSEIARDLPIHAENIAKSLQEFEDAVEADKALHWRGVEIEKSRLNDRMGRLREIQRQISNKPSASNELRMASALLSRAERMMPDQYYDLAGRQ